MRVTPWTCACSPCWCWRCSRSSSAWAPAVGVRRLRCARRECAAVRGSRSASCAGLLVLAVYRPAPAVTYFTVYLLEKLLSVDSLLVFALIFGELAIPAEYQRRVLSWGI